MYDTLAALASAIFGGGQQPSYGGYYTPPPWYAPLPGYQQPPLLQSVYGGATQMPQRQVLTFGPSTPGTQGANPIAPTTYPQMVPRTGATYLAMAPPQQGQQQPQAQPQIQADPGNSTFGGEQQQALPSGLPRFGAPAVNPGPVQNTPPAQRRRR